MTSAPRPSPSHRRACALELELTKGTDGKIRYLRISIGATLIAVLLVGFCLFTQGVNGPWLGLLRLMWP
jgi:hypothetical protein